MLNYDIENYHRHTPLNKEVKKYSKSPYIRRLKDSTIKSRYEEQFQQLLHVDNISIESIIKSLDIESNRSSIFKAGESAG